MSEIQFTPIDPQHIIYVYGGGEMLIMNVIEVHQPAEGRHYLKTVDGMIHDLPNPKQILTEVGQNEVNSWYDIEKQKYLKHDYTHLMP